MTAGDLTTAAERVNGCAYVLTTQHVGGHPLPVGILQAEEAPGEHPRYWVDTVNGYIENDDETDGYDAGLYVTVTPEGEYHADVMRTFGRVLRDEAA